MSRLHHGLSPKMAVRTGRGLASGRRGGFGAGGPETGPAGEGAGSSGGRRAGRGRVLLGWLVSPLALVGQAIVVAALASLLALTALQGHPLPLPRVLAERAEARLSVALGVPVSLGAVQLVAEGDGGLRVQARDVLARDASGVERLAFPQIEASLASGAVLAPLRAPRRVEIEGARIGITRRDEGRLDFGIGTLRLGQRTPLEAVRLLRTRLAHPALAPLEDVRMTGLDLTYEDARTGRVWRARDMTLTLARGVGALSVSLAGAWPGSDGGRVSLRVTLPDAGPARIQISALVDTVPARDIAAMAAALSWLAPLRADVSGALVGGLAPDGGLAPLDGTLGLGPGAFVPATGPPVPFDTAAAYFTFRPESDGAQNGRLRFAELSARGPWGRVAASGHADVTGLAQAMPGAADGADAPALAATLQLTGLEARIDAGDSVAGPVTVMQGALDATLSTAPLRLDIGQGFVDLAAGDDGAPLRVRARGTVNAGAEGWESALDFALADADAARVLALWPGGLVPRTRDWVARNLIDGRVIGAAGGVRLRPGRPPDIALTFGFAEAEVRAARFWPPIEGASGWASVGEHQFTLTLQDGVIETGAGGALDLSGSVFRIADTRLKPPDGDVALRASGSITSVLSLLDAPPLSLLSRAGRPTDLVQGQARLAGDLRFRMGPGIRGEDVAFALSGTLSDVASGRLIPGRVLTAEALMLETDPTGLTLQGTAALDGAAATVRYRQPFGPPDERGPTVVTGSAAVTPETLARFAPGLPDGLARGEGRANLKLAFSPGQAPQIDIRSDLRGIALSLPQLGWSKPAATAGRFEMSGRLGQEDAPPRFDRVALSAPGLEADGGLTLAPGGGLDRVRLDTARLGAWFDGAVDLRGRGAGRAPALALRGGVLDLRDAPFGNGGRAPGGPVSGRLDRLVVAEGLALTDVEAELAPEGGAIAGRLTGRVNGRARVEGTIARGPGGRPSIRLSAADAGGVLAAAGAFDEAQGGTMEVRLDKRSAPGWDGTLAVEGLRVTAAPGLAALLNTISVVGLLDQLNGPGLLFSTIDASFRLTPAGVEIMSASGVGPSLGISADGIYDMRTDRVDLQGVLSPLYALNSIGQIFTRQGEGLIGLSYRVQGQARAPRVTINPLSAFTPGMFREIFREDLPSLEGAGQ